MGMIPRPPEGARHESIFFKAGPNAQRCRRYQINHGSVMEIALLAETRICIRFFAYLAVQLGAGASLRRAQSGPSGVAFRGSKCSLKESV